VIDHTYDAIVVGAGGAGLRVILFDLTFLGCLRSFRGRIQDSLHFKVVPNKVSHCGSIGKNILKNC